MAKKKAKKIFRDVAFKNLILSFPDLKNPKPYKGKTYYTIEGIVSKEHPAFKQYNRLVREVATEAWGEDKDEWPEGLPFMKDGNERQDMKGYAGKFFFKASTQTQPNAADIIDQDGEPFPAGSVKGGMYGGIAVRISHWEFDGDEGISVYLQSVLVDTSKESLNFGGGKSAKKAFGLSEDEESDEKDSEDDEDEEPAPKKKKKPSRDYDDEDEDEAPVKKKKKPIYDEDDDSSEDDEDEEPAPKKKKKPSRDYDDED